MKFLNILFFAILVVTGTATAQVPDYADLTFWAAHPWKQDNSDRVPKDLQAAYRADTSVDVFFVHPTTLIGSEGDWNAALSDVSVNNRTDEKPILYQASVFNASARVFAPRYRQANLKAYYTADKDRAAAAFDAAYEDVRQAFVYYLDHWNQGRPFIIASHSQGTQHAGRLLKEYVENQPLAARFVMAYLIGMPVHADYFQVLQPCQDSTQTGCFATWRTYRTGYAGEAYIAQEKQDVIVTNPLTWRTSPEAAPRKLNAGGLLYNFDKVIPRLTGAQKHGNILWADRPHVPGALFIRLNNYHIADYNLYYVNIREDVARRIRFFFQQQKVADTTANK